MRSHKEEVERLLTAHVCDLIDGDRPRAVKIARQLAFLLEGAITRAGLEGNSALVIEARSMASDMLETL
ncbi:hypothetical protein D3C87_1888530 [compost metagenome]